MSLELHRLQACFDQVACDRILILAGSHAQAMQNPYILANALSLRVFTPVRKSYNSLGSVLGHEQLLVAKERFREHCMIPSHDGAVGFGPVGLMVQVPDLCKGRSIEIQKGSNTPHDRYPKTGGTLKNDSSWDGALLKTSWTPSDSTT